ncbi:MAG: hypothetical protein WAL30_07360 [Candidatus Aquirickettsiella sp.]
MRISGVGNELGFYKKGEEQPLIERKKEDIEINWRSYISVVLKEHIENILSQDPYFNLPEKIDPPKNRKNLGKYDHFETVTTEVDVKLGFFERSFGTLGTGINFVAALANMGVQILSIEMAAGDEKSSGRKYAIPMSFVAFIMAVLTYNYSDAPTVLSNYGKKIDNLTIIRRLAAHFLFKQMGSCTACAGNCWGSLKAHFFPKNTTESSADGNKTYNPSTIRYKLAKLVPSAVIVAMQVTWTTVDSIGAFQTSYATARAAKRIESFMTDDIAYGFAIFLAISSGISMGSFCIPFIANCITDWLKKVDAHYQPCVSDSSYTFLGSETGRRSMRNEEEGWDHALSSPDTERPVHSRHLTY